MPETRYRLGIALQETLKKRYGRLPSAAFVAREFNLRCGHDESICDETARRWIRGSSVPSVERLATLATWLEMDFNCALGLEHGKSAIALAALPRGTAAGDEADRSPLRQLLCQKIACMDQTRQQLLLGIVEAIEQERLANTLQKMAA